MKNKPKNKLPKAIMKAYKLAHQAERRYAQVTHQTPQQEKLDLESDWEMACEELYWQIHSYLEEDE